MNPALGIVIVIGLLVIEGLLFSCSIIKRNEKIANLEDEVRIRDKRIDDKNEIISQKRHEISELYETAVRMKKNNEELSRNNEFLQDQINAYKNRPLKFETFMTQPIEYVCDVHVDGSFFLSVPDAKKQFLDRVAQEFAHEIMQEDNNFDLTVERSFVNPDDTHYRFKIRVVPYNHNINYTEEGFFSGRRF